MAADAVSAAQVVAATVPVPPSTTGTGSSSSGPSIADNFTQFLTLLTTQLQNQDPLSPLDTNQFTQQLVQFAQVEQQLKSNDQLATLVSLQKTTQQTQALGFVGTTVVVDGTTAQLTNSQARWTFSVSKPASTTVTIANSSGQTVYTNTSTVQPGQMDFNWNGKGNDGNQWPDGAYKITVTAKDANGQSVGVSTEVSGVVDSVDMTQDPPILSVGGQNFTLDQIKRVSRPVG
jgi:flagellar basal-body rod modification protein FlgD